MTFHGGDEGVPGTSCRRVGAKFHQIGRNGFNLVEHALAQEPKSVAHTAFGPANIIQRTSPGRSGCRTKSSD